MVKALLFDLDGTVAHTAPSVLDAIRRTLNDYGCPPISMERMMEFFSGSVRDYMHRCLPPPLCEDPRVLKEANRKLDAHYAETFRAAECYPGMKELLREAGTRFLTGMISNKQDAFVTELNRIWFGDQPAFAVTRGVIAGIPPKPDPACALYAARQLSVSPEECLVIGDSEVDVFTARNAGMNCVGVGWGYRGKAYLQNLGVSPVFDTPDELKRWLFAL